MTTATASPVRTAPKLVEVIEGAFRFGQPHHNGFVTVEAIQFFNSIQAPVVRLALSPRNIDDLIAALTAIKESTR